MPQSHHSATLIVPPEPTDHSLGLDHAPITVIEYGDFECPSCKLASQTQIAALYSRCDPQPLWNGGRCCIRSVPSFRPNDIASPHARRRSDDLLPQKLDQDQGCQSGQPNNAYL